MTVTTHFNEVICPSIYLPNDILKPYQYNLHVLQNSQKIEWGVKIMKW